MKSGGLSSSVDYQNSSMTSEVDIENAEALLANQPSLIGRFGGEDDEDDIEGGNNLKRNPDEFDEVNEN